LLFFLWPLVWFLQVFSGVFQRTEGVVVGLQGLTVLAHSAFAQERIRVTAEELVGERSAVADLLG